MKTKITYISPDQNIIEHESGLKTSYTPDFGCEECYYFESEISVCCKIPCTIARRIDKTSGHFIKLTDHENN